MSLSIIVLPLIRLFDVLEHILAEYSSRKDSIRRRRAYIDAFIVPNRVTRKLKERYPHLNERDIGDVISGLKEYFHIVRIAIDGDNIGFVSMPSQIVDEAWHEFILCTREYTEFCQRAFGRFLHHTPAEAMKNLAQAREGLERTWRVACNREGIKPNDPAALPRLFALDTLLEIPDGHHYVLNPDAGREARAPLTPGSAVTLDNVDSESRIHHASHIGGGGASWGGCGGGCGGCGGGCGG